MPVWIDRSIVLAIHDEQLAEHGGATGIRDDNALESALGRPRNLEAIGGPDLYELAAAYAFGLARNHAFVDGNKRVSAVVTELFLDLNGVSLTCDDAALVTTWLAIAAGRMDEGQIADWLRANSA